MSTSSPTTIGTSAGTLTTGSATSPLQITGLASGLNTNAIIQAELEEYELPITNMQAQSGGLQTMNNSLSSIQSSLITAQLDAQAVGDPTLFNPTQAVSSSDPDLITATSASGVGGVIGGSVVTVSQLASAAQRTFTFTSPSSNDSITIDGQPIALKAGASSQDLANAVNSNDNVDVWAAATSSGQIVLSSRTTGDNGSNYIQVSDPGSTLVEQTALAQNGQDAEYTINNTPGASTTDTVEDAIPGVSLTLNAVTGQTPVTIDVQQPTPNVQGILTAVNQFVTDYNSTITSIESTVNTQPSNTASGGTFNQDAGSLFGDNDLENLLSDMRMTMYTPGSGLPSGMAALSDIGITTGASNGSVQQSSLSGELSVDTSTLTAAIQSNPNAVQQVLQQWEQSFFRLAGNAAGPGGDLDTRIQGNSAEMSTLSSQITSMQTIYSQEEKDMEQQWASVESTLSQLQSQGSAFTASTTASTSSTTTSSSSSSS